MDFHINFYNIKIEIDIPYYRTDTMKCDYKNKLNKLLSNLLFLKMYLIYA